MMRTQATVLTRSGLPRLTPILPAIRDLRIRLPNPAGLLRIHRLAFGALERPAELLEVLHGAIHAHLPHGMRMG
jgi:hypothetical protein